MGRVILLAAVLAGGLLAGGWAKEQGGEVPPPKSSGPQEAEVVGLLVDPRSQQPVVVLQGKRDRRNLAMSIGAFESLAGIAVPLQGINPPRPLIHDLFFRLFSQLKVSLKRVEITDLRDDIYYALLYLEVQGKEITVDSRPSDAIALALRAKVPILIEDRVFDKSGAGATSPTSPHF